VFDLKVCKKCYYEKKKIIFCKNAIKVSKNAEYDADFEFDEKVEKILYQKVVNKT
jgi:hypothetical protein